MSLFQALCLLLFNDAHELLLQDIQDATKIGLFGRILMCTAVLSLLVLVAWYSGGTLVSDRRTFAVLRLTGDHLCG